MPVVNLSDMALELCNKAKNKIRHPLFELDESELRHELSSVCAQIALLSSDLLQEGQDIIDNLTKPVGSLGALERIAARLYAIAGGKRELDLDPAIMFTVAGDHGVAAEGVSACKQEVTREMLANMLKGGAGINALCASVGMDLLLVDAASLGPSYPENPQLLQCRVASGTGNISKEAAMSSKACLQALLMGVELAKMSFQSGYRCISAGEMGIANTTPSSALFCAFLGIEARDSVGIGSGLALSQLVHKAEVVQKALNTHSKLIAEGKPLKIMAALGGIEISVMAGLMLGAAFCKIPFLVDGFIASAAFLGGWRMAPALKDYCFFSHCSAESAHARVLQELGEKALLDLDLRLGEGTGAALSLGIMRGAVSMFNNMESFGRAAVSYSPDEARKVLVLDEASRLKN